MFKVCSDESDVRVGLRMKAMAGASRNEWETKHQPSMYERGAPQAMIKS